MKACRPLFRLGRLVGTPGALQRMRELRIDPLALVHRHHHGDWGDIDPRDRDANEAAVADGRRLLSAYAVQGETFWVVTEADRSATTILLPQEY